MAAVGQYACIFVAACVAAPPPSDERACTISGGAAFYVSYVCAHAIAGSRRGDLDR